MSLASLEFEDVEQFTRAFEALFNAGDAAGMASYYAEDAKLLAEHATLLRDRDAIERFWREATAGFRHLRRTPPLGRLTVALAIAIGATGITNTTNFAAIR